MNHEPQAEKLSGDDVIVRSEILTDIAPIFDLTRRAFLGKSYSEGNEQHLIDALRARGALTLSLVAVLGERIAGHVGFSPAAAQDGSQGWYALGPISVDPAFERRGIGGRLIREGFDRLAAMHARGCILIGNPDYYSRHGFVARPDLAPAGVPSANFMLRTLDGNVPKTVISFHPVFDEPDA